MILKTVNFLAFNNRIKSALYFTLFLLIANVSYGQIYYKSSYHSAAGNPAGLNTELDYSIDNTWNTVAQVSFNNNWTSPIAIPFPFEFYGNSMSSLKASHNGLITFSNSTLLPGSNTNLPTSSLPDNTISVLWETFINPNINYYYTGKIATKTFGTPPNRQFWINWYDWPLGLSEAENFACVIEETTNNIYIVDKYNFYGVPSQITATVGVQLNDSTASQYGDDKTVLAALTELPTDNNYYLFEPKPYPANDAGISSLLSPSTTILPGTETIEVTLKNYGTDDLDSVRIHWSVNGTQQTSIYWSGNPIAQDLTTSVTLGSYLFPSGFHTLKVWTELPNGNQDSIPSNDAFEASICTPFQGTYTVGPNADFEDIGQAVDALDCGITGPVIFNVTNDYIGKLQLEEIQGASATNTITFNGGSPKHTIERLSGPGQYSVIEMKGADYVTFKNFNISNPNPNDGCCIFLWQGADHNTFSNCNISLGYNPYYYADKAGIVASSVYGSKYSPGNTCNFLTVKNCSFSYTNYSIILNGSPSSPTVGNRLHNNSLNSVEEGINVSHQDSLEIINNSIRGFNQSGIIYAANINQFKINKNDCYSNSVYHNYQSGIYIYDANIGNPNSTNSEFYNNMVVGKLDFSNLHKTNIFHNTVYSEQTPLSLYYGPYSDLDIRNNIFKTTGSSSNCFELIDPNIIQQLDYNLYHGYFGSASFFVQGINYYSLSSFQGAFPQFNTHSVVLDPTFVYPPSDLHIQPTAVNNLALPILGVTDDIDGDARPSPNAFSVDMGADEINVISTNAITKDQQPEIVLFPNPAESSVTLSVLLNSSNPITVSIFNTVGQKLKTIHSAPIQSEDFILDLSLLEDGLYFINVTIDNQVITKKLILQR